MKCVGIDIGSYSIKVAEVDSNRSEITLSNFAEFPFSQTPTADLQLETIEILRRISELYDSATTRFVVAVPQNRVSSRFKRFPFRERQKILKSLAFEMEDEIPLDINSAIFDGKICAYVGNAADVMAFACPEEGIREALNRLREGGIDPEIISTESSALANLFENWDQPPITITETPELDLPEGVAPPAQAESARLILQLGHTRSQLLVYRNRELIATRNILWGGAEIAQALAKTFSLPYGEAVKILQTKSFILMSSQGASKDQILLSKTVSDIVDSLTRELKLTLIDINAEFNVTFKNLELVGGLSQIQNLAPYLTQSLEIPVNLYHPFEFFKNIAFERTPKSEGASPLAIGLAIEGLKRPRNPAINFRKGDFAKQNNTFNVFWERWKPAFQVATIALILLFVYGVIRDTLTTSLASTADEVLTTQGRAIAGARSTSQIERYIRTQNQLIKNRQILAQLDNVNSSLDLLARVAEKLPQGDTVNGQKLVLDVRHFSVINDTLVIEGKVQNPAHLRNIEQGLRQVAIPESVRAARPTKPVEAPGTAFAFQAKVKRQ